jgi:hypothetical protein
LSVDIEAMLAMHILDKGNARIEGLHSLLF